MDIHGFRVMRHCGANTGFAIAPLETTFYQRALALIGGDSQRAHFSHPRLGGVQPSTLPVAFANVRELDFRSRDSTTLRAMAEYIREHRISTGLGFDVPVAAPAPGHLREAGLRCVVAYRGAPMSGFNGAPKLWPKRLEVRLGRYQPDHRALADRLTALLEDPARHAGFARQARERAVRELSRRRRREALTEEVRRASAACA